MLLWSVWSVWCDGEVISRVTSARDAQARVHSKVNVENPAQRRPLPAYLLRVFKLPITLDVTNKRPFFPGVRPSWTLPSYGSLWAAGQNTVSLWWGARLAGAASAPNGRPFNTIGEKGDCSPN